MHDPVALEGVWKRYRLRRPSLRDRLADLWPANRRRGEELRKPFWALQDVSFTIEPGTTLGIIGENGSGKSTILKLIAGMMLPTRGSVRCRGRLSMLTRLGSGFHEELTGRENVFLQAAILGIGRREISSKVSAIFAFAEVERFANVPIKYYSAGMRLRLAFAIATHVDPELLLVDEALAVGDASFYDRCLDQVARFRASGVTIVLVSHQRYFVEQLCDRAILIHRGEMLEDGAPAEVFREYEQVVARDHPEATGSAIGGDPDRSPLLVEAVELVGFEGQREPVVEVDRPLRVRITLRAVRATRSVAIGVQIAREWHVLHGTRTNRHGVEIHAQPNERVTVELEYRSLSLMGGLYHIHVLVLEHALALTPALEWKRAASFRVMQALEEGAGLVRMAHVWRRID